MIWASLLLAACSGGKDEQTAPADETASLSPVPDAAPTDTAAYTPDPAIAPPAAPEAGIGAGDKAIPAAIQGRWGLAAADCTSTWGDAKGLLTIDAANLRFYESHGELARIRERSDSRIVADYKFSGEGMEWDRLVLLGVEDGGRTLVRREWGEDASAEPLRYTRCAN
ncbi:MAG TPA: hypothetical protein PKD99_06900 [Sphingopyxis sp.]|nr:hypothetical protein [Sphingopyxis sp.]HMP44819.1 hypothetical protein [Sphingopyxis sp.]HMQ19626.1 hypothetical protein [Sphingopyxis sp.]